MNGSSPEAGQRTSSKPFYRCIHRRKDGVYGIAPMAASREFERLHWRARHSGIQRLLRCH